MARRPRCRSCTIRQEPGAFNIENSRLSTVSTHCRKIIQADLWRPHPYTIPNTSTLVTERIACCIGVRAMMHFCPVFSCLQKPVVKKMPPVLSELDVEEML